MKHILLRSIAGAGLLLLSVSAPAQYLPRAGDRSYTREARRGVAQFLERVRADLDGAESTASSFNADVDRIIAVRESLNVFQRRMDAGDYDQRELTETIVSLQKVLDNNRLYDRTRGALADDLNRMRDMRASHDDER